MKNIVLTFMTGCLLFASCTSSGNGESNNRGQQPVYFLVGEIIPIRHDSYVIPLLREDDIQHARNLIQFGVQIGRPLVVARIQSGADNINRDLLSTARTPWTWHVTTFEAFVDVTAEVLDGNPTMLEQDVQRWILKTGVGLSPVEGEIGFWDYTIIQELSGYPIAIPP